MGKFPLFKNSVKEIKTQLLQFFCCTILIICGVGIFSGIKLGVDNISTTFAAVNKKTHIHEFTLNPSFNNSYNSLKFNTESALYTDAGASKQNSKQQNTMLIWNYLAKNPQFNFKQDKLNIFTYQQIGNNDVNSVQVISVNKILDLPFKTDKSLDLINSINGNNCYVNKEWAKANNKKIGDQIKIMDTNLTIVGFGVSPINAYPVIKPNPFPDFKKNCFVITNQNNWNQMNKKLGKTTEQIVGKFNGNLTNSQISSKIASLNDTFLTSLIKPLPKDFSFIKETYTSSGFNGEMNIFYLILNARNSNLLAVTFISIILGASLIVIFIVLKRRVQDSRKRIGILKSLGYRNGEIAWSYTMFTLVSSLVGSAIGFLIGFLVQTVITSTTITSFPMPTYNFDITTFLLSFAIPIVLLTTFSFLFAYKFVKKNTISLIRGDFQYKESALTRKVSLLSTNWKFNHKFSSIMATKSIGKMITIFVTIIITSFLTIFILAAGNVAESFAAKTKNSMAYNYKYGFNTTASLNGLYQTLPEPCLSDPNNAPNCTFDTGSKNPNFITSKPTELSVTQFEAKFPTQGQTFNRTAFNGNYIKILNNNRIELKEFLTIKLLTGSPKVKQFAGIAIGYLEMLVKNGNHYLTFGFNVYQPKTDYTYFELWRGNTNKKLDIDTIDNSTSFIPFFTPTVINKIKDFTPSSSKQIPIYVSQFYAAKNKIKVGSSIELKDNWSAYVVGINTDNLKKVGYTTRLWLNKYIEGLDSGFQNIISHKYDNKIYSKSNSFIYPNVYFPIFFTNSNSASMSLTDFTDIKSLFLQIEDKIAQMNNIIWIFIVIATFINLIILLSISALIITENQVFISIMKVLGYRDREISILFSKIYAPFVLLGFLVAIPIVYIVTDYLTNQISQALNFNFPFTPEVWQIFISFAIITLLTLVSYWVGKNLVKKIGYLRTINSE